MIWKFFTSLFELRLHVIMLIFRTSFLLFFFINQPTSSLCHYQYVEHVHPTYHTILAANGDNGAQDTDTSDAYQGRLVFLSFFYILLLLIICYFWTTYGHMSPLFWLQLSFPPLPPPKTETRARYVFPILLFFIYLQSDRYAINQHYQQQHSSILLPPPNSNGAQDIEAGKFFFLFYTIYFTTNNLLLLDFVRPHLSPPFWPPLSFPPLPPPKMGTRYVFLSYSFSYTNDYLQLERYTINQHYEQQHRLHSSVLPPPPNNDDQQQQEHSTVTPTGTKYNSGWPMPTGGEKTCSMCFSPCHLPLPRHHRTTPTGITIAVTGTITLHNTGDDDGPCDRDSIDMLQITTA